jgi:hypothetical protein
LRRIASGELAVEHPKLRGKAILALGFDDVETEKTLDTLRSVLANGEPALKVRTLRALGRLGPKMVVDEVRASVRDPATRPDVALAAARVAASIGGEEVAEELRELRERLLPLVPNPNSPSILSLDRLIAQAKGLVVPPSEEEEPKLDI